MYNDFQRRGRTFCKNCGVENGTFSQPHLISSINIMSSFMEAPARRITMIPGTLRMVIPTPRGLLCRECATNDDAHIHDHVNPHTGEWIKDWTSTTEKGQ